MKLSSGPAFGAVAGAVVGLGVTMTLALSGWPPGPPGPIASLPIASLPIASLPTAEAAASFLSAWGRYRRGTWFVASHFERVTADGRRLDSDSVAVQRPPQRRAGGFGAANGRDARTVWTCSPTPEAMLVCRRRVAPTSYAGEVSAEMRILSSYVTRSPPLRSPPLYEVRATASGCFVLRLALEMPAPPYGERARFCFDPATGALVETETRRPEAVDRTVATTVRAVVTDADLAPPIEVDALR